MKAVVSIFIIFSCMGGNILAQSPSGQGYNALIKLSDSCYNMGDYACAGTMIDSAITFLPNGIVNMYNASCYWSLAGDIFKSYKRLIRAFELGYIDEYFKKDKDLSNLKSDSVLWAQALRYYAVKIENYERQYDTGMRNLLKNLRMLDQKYREDIHVFQNHQREQHSIDSLNLIQVRRIIDSCGYPRKDVVGPDLVTVPFLVIQHAPVDSQLVYYDKIIQLADSGHLPYSSVAMFIDRVRTNTGRPQLYGTQVGFRDGKAFLYPIEDEKNVNDRRKGVGLGPLEDYVKRWGIAYKLPE